MFSQGERIVKEALVKVFPDDEFHFSEGVEGVIFDFYNERMRLAIQYQGKQHYEFTPLWHRTPDGLDRQKERDKRKREFCLKHNITLVEVPYWLSSSEVEQLLARYRCDV